MKKLILISLLVVLSACDKAVEQKKVLTVNEYLFEPELAKKLNRDCVNDAAIADTPICENATRAAYLIGVTPSLAQCYKTPVMDRDCINKYIDFMERHQK